MLAAAVAVLGLVSLELVRSVGVLDHVAYPWAVQSLAVVTGCGPARRAPPLAAGGGRRSPPRHMLVVGLTMPAVMGQFTLQLVYFVAILVAASRGRRTGG